MNGTTAIATKDVTMSDTHISEATAMDSGTDFRAGDIVTDHMVTIVITAITAADTIRPTVRPIRKALRKAIKKAENGHETTAATTTADGRTDRSLSINAIEPGRK
jgi:hypothetical protein